MSRVTPTEVKVIIDTPLTDPIVQIWIDGANTIVTANAECIGSDETLLTQVELYLSAHFVGMLDPGIRGFVSKEKTEELETSFSNPVTLSNMIDNTPYGTMANRLSDGCLANIDDRAITLFSV